MAALLANMFGDGFFMCFGFVVNSLVNNLCRFGTIIWMSFNFSISSIIDSQHLKKQTSEKKQPLRNVPKGLELYFTHMNYFFIISAILNGGNTTESVPGCAVNKETSLRI